MNVAEEKARCSNDHFRCEIDGTCIPNTWLCDDHVDCDDGSDEIECSKLFHGSGFIFSEAHCRFHVSERRI